jgi:hypothetical protein
MTSLAYEAGNGGWCGMDENFECRRHYLPVVPEFVIEVIVV